MYSENLHTYIPHRAAFAYGHSSVYSTDSCTYTVQGPAPASGKCDQIPAVKTSGHPTGGTSVFNVAIGLFLVFVTTVLVLR